MFHKKCNQNLMKKIELDKLSFDKPQLFNYQNLIIEQLGGRHRNHFISEC